MKGKLEEAVLPVPQFDIISCSDTLRPYNPGYLRIMSTSLAISGNSAGAYHMDGVAQLTLIYHESPAEIYLHVHEAPLRAYFLPEEVNNGQARKKNADLVSGFLSGDYVTQGTIFRSLVIATNLTVIEVS